MSYQPERREYAPEERRRPYYDNYRRDDSIGAGGGETSSGRRRGSRGSRSPTPPSLRNGGSSTSHPTNNAAPNPVRSRPDLSPSRERSRGRERHRRKLQAECIRRAGGFKKLADSEGKEPVRLFWDGFQWVAKTGASSALLSDPILVNSTRKLRRLYFGNLPLHLGLTETNFQHIVFQEMKKRGFCNNPTENPVLCVWFAKDKGNYGFVEFASVEETERALTMDGMDCLGVAIKVSRPNDYCSATQAPTVLPVLAQQSAQLLANALPNLAAGPLAAAIAATGSTALGGLGQLPDSKLVLIKSMVLETDVESSAEYEEILDDVREGCGKYGTIMGAFIVSPDKAAETPDLNMGDVYLLFETATEADSCLAAMQQRKYFDRTINAMKAANQVWDSKLRALVQNNEGGVVQPNENHNNDTPGGVDHDTNEPSLSYPLKEEQQGEEEEDREVSSG